VDKQIDRPFRFTSSAQDDRGREKRLDEAAKLQMQKVTASQDDRVTGYIRKAGVLLFTIFEFSANWEGRLHGNVVAHPL